MTWRKKTHEKNLVKVKYLVKFRMQKISDNGDQNQRIMDYNLN